MSEELPGGVYVVMAGLVCIVIALALGCGAIADRGGPDRVALDDIRPYAMPESEFVTLPPVQVVSAMALEVVAKHKTGVEMERIWYAPVIAADRDVAAEFETLGPDALAVLRDVHLFVALDTRPDPQVPIALRDDLSGHLSRGLGIDGVMGAHAAMYPSVNLHLVAVITPGGPRSLALFVGLLGLGVLLVAAGGWATARAA